MIETDAETPGRGIVGAETIVTDLMIEENMTDTRMAQEKGREIGKITMESREDAGVVADTEKGIHIVQGAVVAVALTRKRIRKKKNGNGHAIDAEREEGE